MYSVLGNGRIIGMKKQAIVYGFVFLSGIAGLIYQILWMKQLGLLFGSTSQATAATLAAFFAGLAAGSWYWGRRSATNENPLRIYAQLEIGIAVTALLYFVVLSGYQMIYPWVYQSVHSTVLLSLIRFALAMILIFPPTFCMGGTIPVLAQHIIKTPDTFGRHSALLYGINTLGAAIGAVMAGFFLPLWLGFNKTCMLAITITSCIALGSWLLSSKVELIPKITEKKGRAQKKKPNNTGRWAIWLICFLSGFGVLSLEVLWVRMFAQVLENSVYTFASILVVVLISLAGGALLSSLLTRWSVKPLAVLALLLVAGGFIVGMTPQIFMWITNDLQIIVSRGTWAEYIGVIFTNVSIAVGPPALLLGMVFPFLMKAEEAHTVQAGLSLGRLACLNTIGAILGSLATGFLFLETIGMWGTMLLIALCYLMTALILPLGWGRMGWFIRSSALGLMLLFVVFLNPADLPTFSIDTLRQNETVLETWEGSDCTVAVVEDRFGRSIKINSHYGLGSTGGFMQERMQADIPLLAKPGIKDIFFLGMGTGITAGSALDSRFPDVSKVITCELVPEVITAARKYMTDIEGYDFTGGLFDDPRSTVLAEDGRHYLMATDEKFDLVNADLFVPFRSGAGSLYTREHFDSVHKRLNPGGLFFQWLPLYQLTENEFMIIARTMLEVFPQVSLWRNGFQPGEEVLALVGHQDLSPLPAADLNSKRDKQLAVLGKNYYDARRINLPLNSETILLFYAGNLTESRSLFETYPINTDDRPLIEYMAPRSYREQHDKPFPWFVGPYASKFIDSLQELCPADLDPLLVNRSAANRRLPAAGSAFHRTHLWMAARQEEECKKAWDEFLDNWLE